MVYVGIDFSVNSPGLCIKEDNKYKFISFFNYDKDHNDFLNTKTKLYEVHRELINKKIISGYMYTRNKSSDNFLEKERNKLKDCNTISSLIHDTILSNVKTSDNISVCLEGFSYGSTGNSFIDIIQYNSFLRAKLLNTFGENSIYVFQPTHVKRLAGKGNANKHYMIDAFQKNVLNDNDLLNDSFWQWIKDKDYSEKIPLPVADLVDSYFVLKAGEVLNLTS